MRQALLAILPLLVLSLSSFASAQDVPFETVLRGRAPLSVRVGKQVIQDADHLSRTQLTLPAGSGVDFTQHTLLLLKHLKGTPPLCRSVRQVGNTLRVSVEVGIETAAPGMRFLLLRLPKTQLEIDVVYDVEFRPVDVSHQGFHITGVDTMGTALYMVPPATSASLRTLLGKRVVARGRASGGTFKVESVLSPQAFDEEVLLEEEAGKVRAKRGSRRFLLDRGPQRFLASMSGRRARIRGFVYPGTASAEGEVVVDHVRAFSARRTLRVVPGSPIAFSAAGEELQVHGELGSFLLTRTPGQAAFVQTRKPGPLNPFFRLPAEGRVAARDLAVAPPAASSSSGIAGQLDGTNP